MVISWENEALLRRLHIMLLNSPAQSFDVTSSSDGSSAGRRTRYGLDVAGTCGLAVPHFQYRHFTPYCETFLLSDRIGWKTEAAVLMD